jgi:glucosamine--fructose-6-phosphate aminotransferase (isomerizing)
MAREIGVIPLTTEGLLAEHTFVTTVANRIRDANQRVVVVAGRASVDRK